MTNKIILLSGGARSGKSGYGQRLAEEIQGQRVYIATCPARQADDPEMEDRINRHRADRCGRGWRTVEEPLALAAALAANEGAAVIMVDCLTLWISNLLFAHGDQTTPLREDDVAERCRQMIQTARSSAATVIFISNEVGLGIVPENPLARLYRDLVGRCNQVVAAGADEVVIVHCGIPVRIK